MLIKCLKLLLSFIIFFRAAWGYGELDNQVRFLEKGAEANEASSFAHLTLENKAVHILWGKFSVSMVLIKSHQVRLNVLY